MSFIPAPPEQPVLSVHLDKHIISLTGEDVRDFLNDIPVSYTHLTLPTIYSV